MRNLRFSLVLIASVVLASLAGADTPPKLKEMQAIFQEERSRVIKPLVMKYIAALERHQDQATRAADLDAALAFRQEVEQLRERFAFAIFHDGPSLESTQPASISKPKAAAILNAEKPSFGKGALDKPGMVWIVPGKFLMGSRADELGRRSDETQHRVTLTKGFWMGVHEVTQAEYVAVTGLANPSNFAGDTNRPVDTVTWSSAVAYCDTLTTSERAANRIPNDWEYRLPSETEWEYCSRAGARNTRFGFGDDIEETAIGEYAWYTANSDNTTHPVGQKRANAWGLMDMGGNVWEWCQDWYADYPAGSATDPQGPVSGSDRVLRGGYWGGSANDARCSRRGRRDPDVANRDYGFRVVLAPGQP
jgi:formylglycine-generating enzyme required for sulfatase activity